jgi:hypothetical protein
MVRVPATVRQVAWRPRPRLHIHEYAVGRGAGRSQEEELPTRRAAAHGSRVSSNPGKGVGPSPDATSSAGGAGAAADAITLVRGGTFEIPAVDAVTCGGAAVLDFGVGAMTGIAALAFFQKYRGGRFQSTVIDNGIPYSLGAGYDSSRGVRGITLPQIGM